MFDDVSERYHQHGSNALNPVRTAAPTKVLLTLDEAKLHLRADGTDDDTLIGFLIDVVTEQLDGWSGTLGRALLTQTWRSDFRLFPVNRLRLPFRPVTAITSIKYYDTANVQQTLPATVYDGPLTDALGPYAILKFAQYWPIPYWRDDAVSVTFTAGYATADAVPKRIRAAALLMLGDLYENRETVMTDLRAASVKIEMSTTVEALLAPLRTSWA